MIQAMPEPVPMLRSTSSAVARRVMTARSLRLPPHGHLQTSASKWKWVRCVPGGGMRASSRLTSCAAVKTSTFPFRERYS
jgi:hypothetical protein